MNAARNSGAAVVPRFVSSACMSGKKFPLLRALVLYSSHATSCHLSLSLSLTFVYIRQLHSTQTSYCELRVLYGASVLV